MAYYQDLSDYEYWLSPAVWDEDGPGSLEPEDLYRWNSDGEAFRFKEVNVGWLDQEHEFETGEPDPMLLELLDQARKASVYNLTRGWHQCFICGGDVGKKEIRFEGIDVVYATPELIAHYVRAHDYAPPRAFVDAVIATKGIAPETVPGKRRPLCGSALVREPIAVDELRANSIDALLRRYRIERLEVDRQGDEMAVFCSALIVSKQDARFERQWRISVRAFLNTYQGAAGISTMIGSAIENAQILQSGNPRLIALLTDAARRKKWKFIRWSRYASIPGLAHLKFDNSC